MIKKEVYKETFKKALTGFAGELEQIVSTGSGEWTIKGLIDVYENIYTLSADTKLISKILEIHILPQILTFAEKTGYDVVPAGQQNYYPDLTFINKQNADIKFAVDLKTTYRKKNGIANFTLGSHGSYFTERDKQKNIQYPYNQYSGHYCLGIIYTRAAVEKEATTSDIYPLSGLQSIHSVIRDFEFFAAEKWKIASDKQGSGNTANIGCALRPEDLKNENGIFSALNEKWFDEYWMNFGKATMVRKGKKIKITCLKDFLTFRGKPELWKQIADRKAHL